MSRSGSFPFLRLPEDIRRCVYGLLLPDRPVPARYVSGYDDGHFLRPLRSDGRLCNPHIFCVNRQIRAEVEDVFHKQASFEIAFYCRIRPQGCTGVLWDEWPEVNFLGRCLPWPIAELDANPVFAAQLRHARKLCVKVFSPLSSKPLRCCLIQTSLYGFVSFLKNQQPLSSIELQAEMLRSAESNELSDAVIPRWNDHYLSAQLETAVFQFEPFHFLRVVDSATLGTFAGWQHIETDSGSGLRGVQGPWPISGHLGQYREWLERLMLSDEPVNGLNEISSFYDFMSGFSDAAGLKHRLTGNIERICSSSYWNSLHADHKHRIDMPCEACIQGDQELSKQFATRASSVRIEYLAVPNFRFIWRNSGESVQQMPSYVTRLPPNLLCPHQTLPSSDHLACRCGGTASRAVNR